MKVAVVTDPNQSQADNLNNVRRDDSRHFRNKKREYLEGKINEETNNKNNNIRDMCRDINEIKKGYEPRTNIVRMRWLMCLQTPTIF